MKTIKTFNSQAKYMFAVVGLLVATILPGLVPTLVAAETVTERSISVSSSSAAATNVSYKVKFMPVKNAAAFVVDFCSDSPLIGETCTPPVGFNATAAASTDTDVTAVAGSTSKIVVTSAITGGTAVDVDLTGITNPTDAGPLYARIVTYDTVTNANSYASDNLGTGNQDEGGVAIAITDTIGVGGSVLESLTFCVASATITKDCANADTNPPVLRLGQTIGDITALVPGQVSSGNLYTQLSTNAANGAVVWLKSDATGCGGLMRAGDPSACDIAPALLSGGVTGSEAKFGVKTATATGTDASASGTLQPAVGSAYNSTTYMLNYVDGDAEGVTGPYGDPFLDTDSKPANNQNMTLTFGASVTNDTPAGEYSADLSMIATGTF